MSKGIIRKCTNEDLARMYDIINDAARAYKGIIPDDRWREPYMPLDELEAEIGEGVQFWGYEQGKQLIAVMGIQDKTKVCLIRHAYVYTASQGRGVGSTLLKYLESLSGKPILIGTWADAHWAVDFYIKNGYRVLPRAEGEALLRKYWHIPERQISTSVVLASSKWQ